MNIAVTGATGFVGNHVVEALLARGHAVTAVARNESKARISAWFPRVRFLSCDLEQRVSFEQLGRPDIVMHLAWAGLPNYKALHHLDQVAAQYRFARALADEGLPHLLISGTCFEYGLQSGSLSEDMAALPGNPYAVAKDALRRLLEPLAAGKGMVLQWARLFYMYGPGQNPNSLLPQLDHAIERGDEVFNMSAGEQLRDFMPVETVAARLVDLDENPGCTGVVNVCSGRPTSVRRLVEEHLARRGAQMRLNLGHYPYPDYEPLAFWGNAEKLHSAIGRQP